MIIQKLKDLLKDRPTVIATAFFSMFFSLALWLTTKVHFSGNVSGGLDQNYFTNIVITDVVFLLLSLIITFIAVILIIFLLDLSFVKKCFCMPKQSTSKKIFVINFVIVFSVWFVFFLTFYPGVGMNDTLWTLIHPLRVSGQHPVMYNAFLYGCYTIGKKLFHSANAGLAVYSIVQMLIMDMGISFCVAWFHKKGCPKTITYLIGISFALLPIVANFSITSIKDPLFSTSIMLFIPMIYEIVHSNGEFLKTKKGCILFSLLCITMTLLRNNGIYVFLGLSVIMFFMFKNVRKILVLMTCMILIITSIPNGILKTMGVKPMLKEAVAIPMQQIAMVAAEGKLTDLQDEAFVNNILPSFEEHYAPMNVDTIKWHGDFSNQFLEEHKKEFFTLWFKQLVKHPDLYLKAYFLETYGFWSIGTYCDNQGAFFTIRNIGNNDTLINWVEKENLINKQVFPEPMHQSLTTFYKSNCKYFGAGSCFWISMLVATILIAKKRYKYLLVLAPCTLVWMTIMISVPIAFAFRYAFMYVLCLPFIIFLPFIDDGMKQKSEC